MRILLTNITLASRSGTEVNVRDLAIGLLRRGHRPVVYSPELGDIAAEIRAATVPVVDDLGAIAAPPEVIHGHHHPTTLTALLRFPGVPAVYHVHDWSSWYDEPLHFPRVVLYAPVDATNADRLELEHGIERGRIRMLLNSVDLVRCQPRPALPLRPRRAIALTNKAPDGYLRALRAACEQAHIDLQLVGAEAGRVSDRPEELLAEADLVFAKGRSALEAMAVGGAVVLCDELGLGELVTSDSVERMRPLNFGRRLLQRPVTPEGVLGEIERYDAGDAARVCAWVRREADLQLALDSLVSVYEEAVALGRQARHDWQEESRAVSAYLQRWAPRFHDFGAAAALAGVRAELQRAAAVAGEALSLRSRLDEAEARGSVAAGESSALRRELGETKERSAAAAGEASALRRELEWVTGTAAWRWRERLARHRWLIAAYRRLRRLPSGEPAAEGDSPRGDRVPSVAPTLVASSLVATTIGERAEHMVSAGGFLGVPVEDFEEEGRLQLVSLLRLGLRTTSRVLDIGCGCLRGGYWLIHFLDVRGYCGIEPHRGRVELGLTHLLEPGLAAAKLPRFSHAADFDTSVFGERFDFFLARSIWSHAAKPQISRMLDGFVRDAAPGAVFLTSYFPAGPSAPAYEGATWVGTSHESSVIGVIHHDTDWIVAECRSRGLGVEERPGDDFAAQRWLAIRRGS